MATDARLKELEFLRRVEQGAMGRFAAKRERQAEMAMAVSVVRNGYVNDLENMGWSYDSNFRTKLIVHGENVLSERHDVEHWDTLNSLMGYQEVTFFISHRGRLRISELEQALKTGRDMDPFGILFAKRHAQPALAMALAQTSQQAPLHLSFLDMNGLKAINDAHGHDAGDVAIKAFLSTVRTGIPPEAEAFQYGSGDEVVVILPDRTEAAAHDDLVRILLMLAREKPKTSTTTLDLSASAGLVATTVPTTLPLDLIDASDKEMYRAKAESKVNGARRNALAVKGKPVEFP